MAWRNPSLFLQHAFKHRVNTRCSYFWSFAPVWQKMILVILLMHTYSNLSCGCVKSPNHQLEKTNPWGISTPKNRRFTTSRGRSVNKPQVGGLHHLGTTENREYLGRLLPQTPSRILGILAHLKMGMEPKYYYYVFLRWLSSENMMIDAKE